MLDLVAAVLAAGAPVATTLDLVAEALGEYAPAPGRAAGGPGPPFRLGCCRDPPTAGRAGSSCSTHALLLARDAGVPPAGDPVAAAEQERRRRADRRRLAAARLGVQVVLPTGLCLLPAFVLLTVVPMVVALLGGG